MRIVQGPKAAETLAKFASRGAADLSRVEPAVRQIVNDVRPGGDRRLRAYAEKYDRLAKGNPLQVSPEEIAVAWDSTTPEFRNALKQAARNIRRYCQWQMPRSWMREMQSGLRVGQIVTPLERVGCYVPGGRYPLPSTLLMTVIPAQVAGVKEITVVSPNPARETLAAAALLGVKRMYRVGGAQAIAALAYGTESVAKVDKIVGPGNLYVTAAKKLVAWDCAIDMLAGPTEVVLVSDEDDPRFLAADLVAQAEHDPDASAVFITTSRELATAVVNEVKRQGNGNSVARTSLNTKGLAIVANSRKQALEFANSIAPEHLTVAAADVSSVRNAGSVFVGAYSPQAMGDYAAGPNHVLPTGSAARFRGGLSVLDFVKIVSVQECTRGGLEGIARTVTTLAEAEGLKGHAESVRVRTGGIARRRELRRAAKRRVVVRTSRSANA